MEKLVLRRDGYESFENKWFYVSTIATIVGIIILGICFYIFSSEAFFEFFSISGFLLFLAHLAMFHIQYLWIVKPRIEINDLGIKYTSGMPSFLKRFSPDRDMSWIDIKTISFIKLKHPSHQHLGFFSINTNEYKFKISPSEWIDQNNKIKKESITWFDRIFKQKEIAQRKVDESPLFKIFEERDLLIETPHEKYEDPEWTDINSSPIGIAVFSVFVLSLIYFTTETYFTLSEYYAEKTPYIWFGVIGFLAVIPAFYILKQSKLKPKEIGIMAALVGFGVALVSYPMLLRVNQWTDDNGLRSYSYTLVEKGRWMPDTMGLGDKYQMPELVFDLALSDYWNKFEINSTKEFELRKGGLGFYQVNMEPIYADQREFYEGKKKKVETAQK